MLTPSKQGGSASTSNMAAEMPEQVYSRKHRANVCLRLFTLGLFALACLFIVGGGLSIVLFYEHSTGLEVYEAYWLLCWFGVVLFVYLCLGKKGETHQRHEFHGDDTHDDYSEDDFFFPSAHGGLRSRSPSVSQGSTVPPSPASVSRDRRNSSPLPNPADCTDEKANMNANRASTLELASLDTPRELLSENDRLQSDEEEAEALTIVVDRAEEERTDKDKQVFSLTAVIDTYTKKDYRAITLEPKPVSPWVVTGSYVVVQLLAFTTPLMPCFFRLRAGKPFAGNNSVAHWIVAWNVIVSPVSIHAFLFWSPSKVLAKLRGYELMVAHVGYSVRRIRNTHDLRRWHALMWDLRKHIQDSVRRNNRQFLAVIVSAFLLSLILIILFFFTPQDSLTDPLWIQLFELGLVMCLLSLAILWRAAIIAGSFLDAATRLQLLGVKHGSRPNHFTNCMFYQRITNYWLTTPYSITLRVMGMEVAFGNKFNYLLGLLLSNVLLFFLKSVVIPFIRDYSVIEL